jgi:hypothetical protein
VQKHGTDKESTPKPKHTRSFTLRDVVKSTHKERIQELISSKTNEPAGHKDWLRHHPAAVSQVMEELTEAETEVAENVLKEWLEEGVPVEVQRM